jgi:hypothetical protein
MTPTVCRTANTLDYLRGGGHFWVHLNRAYELKSSDCRVISLELVQPDVSMNSIGLETEPAEHMRMGDELRQFEAGDMSVKWQGLTHCKFSELSPHEQCQDLEQSPQLLEQHLDKQITVFAFPYEDGASPKRISTRGGCHAAFLYGAHDAYIAASLPIANPYRFDRLAMGSDTPLGAVLGDLGVRCDS